MASKRLKEFRELAEKVSDPKELITLLTDDLLEESGWEIHTKHERLMGATKVDAYGREWEIRVSTLNQTIGGTITRGSQPRGVSRSVSRWFDEALAIWEPYPLTSVRRTEEADWRTLVAAI